MLDPLAAQFAHLIGPKNPNLAAQTPYSARVVRLLSRKTLERKKNMPKAGGFAAAH